MAARELHHRLRCRVGTNVTPAVRFSKSANVERLRFHDARATFVIWGPRAGYGWAWISDRTSHLTAAMMERFDRIVDTTAPHGFPACSAPGLL